jgi:hypothetical protein
LRSGNIISNYFLSNLLQLAVQAATGSERHKSFLALFALQEQLSSNHDDDPQLVACLARVVVKLVAKVIREEETKDHPFSRRSLDMDALICAMEDTLIGRENADENANDLIKTVLMSILKSYGNLKALFDQMKQLDMDPHDSELGKLASVCATDMNLPVSLEITTSDRAATMNGHPKTPSKDVAALVSRLGNASSGPDREAARDAIRRFTDANGNQDLDAHLKQLSGPFREFIEEQLGSFNATHTTPAEKGSVSERIENLRSRLQVSEGISRDRSTFESGPAGDRTRQLEQPRPTAVALSTPPPKSSGLARPAPSKLATPTASFAQRDNISGITPRRSDAAAVPVLGSAAALRARLAAVRQQAQLDKAT